MSKIHVHIIELRHLNLEKLNIFFVKRTPIIVGYWKYLKSEKLLQIYEFLFYICVQQEKSKSANLLSKKGLDLCIIMQNVISM